MDAIIGDHGQLVALFNITRSSRACLCYVPQNIALGHVLGKASWLRLERTDERERMDTLGETHKAEAERAVNAVVDGIKAGVKKSKNVQLVGFGTFKVASRGPAPE
jgi:hypothetical protein